MSSTQALSKIINDLHTFSAFHPERACSILHNRSYQLLTHEQAPVEGRADCTGQMGHKHAKEASEDDHLYSNTQEEFRWAHEIARLEFSQENSV